MSDEPIDLFAGDVWADASDLILVPTSDGGTLEIEVDRDGFIIISDMSAEGRLFGGITVLPEDVDKLILALRAAKEEAHACPENCS